MLSTSVSLQRGISLVEAMVTIAILGLMMALGVPSFMEWIQNAQIRSAAVSVLGGLQSARAEALRRNAQVQFILTGNGGAGETGWEIRLRSDNQLLQAKPAVEAGANVQITTTPGGARMITFNGLGRVLQTNSDGSSPFSQVELDNPALAADQSRELRVTVSDGGSIRMCDPATPGSDTRAC